MASLPRWRLWLGLLLGLFGPSAAMADPTAIHPVIRAEMARGEALRRGDADALAAVLSDNLRYVHSNGRVESKMEAVGALRDGSVTYARFATTAHHVQEIVAGVVVLGGRISQLKLTHGKGSEIDLLFSAVWREESGAWRMVSIQTARVPPPQ